MQHPAVVLVRPEEEPKPAADGRFATTHWSVVVSAARSQSPRAGEALEALARTYWYPLYLYLRRTGLDRHGAEDLTQDFFARRVVTQLVFKGVNPEGGKFRSWLLSSLRNFQRNEWARGRAKKRGGACDHLPLDGPGVEERCLAGLGAGLSPEESYDRAWAMALLDTALEQLGARYSERGTGPLFEELRRFLPGAGGAGSYAEVAGRLGKSEAAVKMAVSRLRREYGLVLREEICRTVSGPAEVDEEIGYLLSVVGAS